MIKPRITVDLPTVQLNIQEWSHINNIQLADPLFYVPGKIELLISAEISMDIICDKSLFVTSQIKLYSLGMNKILYYMYNFIIQLI